VDDVSTSLLMQQFYKYLQTMPKAEALRRAMADVSAKPEFEHPFYWAAFVLYGDYK
jgi:CHAT domain-containing protein